MSRDPQFDRIGDDPTLLATLLGGIEPVALEPQRKAALRQRVLERAAASAVPQMEVLLDGEGRWVKLLPMVYLKPLRIDREKREQTSLWRLEPGAVVPAHDHTADEECLVLDGKLLWDGVEYGRGDYLLARKGLHHTQFTSPTGALLMIRSELSPELEAVFA
jgi:anti-sigma factor ChrR (cupin superfamily)